jgi:hypothetical protein
MSEGSTGTKTTDTPNVAPPASSISPTKTVDKTKDVESDRIPSTIFDSKPINKCGDYEINLGSMPCKEGLSSIDLSNYEEEKIIRFLNRLPGRRNIPDIIKRLRLRRPDPEPCLSEPRTIKLHIIDE